SIDSFFDVFVEITTDGGATWQPVHCNGVTGTFLNPTSLPGANPKVYDTEMVSLDLSGGTLPPGMNPRASPTRASHGHAESRSLGGGQFRIDSFFDVFVELSVEGGATWMPAPQSTRLILGTPQPTAVRVSTWGAIKSYYR